MLKNKGIYHFSSPIVSSPRFDTLQGGFSFALQELSFLILLPTQLWGVIESLPSMVLQPVISGRVQSMLFWQQLSEVYLLSQSHFCSVTKFSDSLHNRHIPDFTESFLKLPFWTKECLWLLPLLNLGPKLIVSALLNMAHKASMPGPSCRNTGWYRYQTFTLLMSYTLALFSFKNVCA